MKIKLKIKETVHTDVVHWTRSFPFIVNPRGILVHRARGIITFLRDGKETHHAVRYWCGNQTCFDVEAGPRSKKNVVVEVPPKDRLLCQFCEIKAVANGELSADKLAGRHVHIGVLRAHRVCCRKCDEN